MRTQLKFIPSSTGGKSYSTHLIKMSSWKGGRRSCEVESHVTSWFGCSSKNTYGSFLLQYFHHAGMCVNAFKFITRVLLFFQVYLKAPMILNGVCVIWKGWIDLQRLDGMGCLEFDEERAQVRTD